MNFCKGLIAALMAISLVIMAPGIAQAEQDVIFSENFDELDNELYIDKYTHNPPYGWNRVNDPSMRLGKLAWQGWSFTRLPDWEAAGPNQKRNDFKKADNVFVVADPDSWEDKNNPDRDSDFNSTLVSPSIDVAGTEKLELTFDSAWRPEGNQIGLLVAIFDGGSPQMLLKYDSQTTKDESKYWNEKINKEIDVPAGAKEMVLKWQVYKAKNNWYWAIDNISLAAMQTSELIADGDFADNNASGDWTVAGNISFYNKDVVEFNRENKPPNGTIAQLFATTPGQLYKVNFSHKLAGSKELQKLHVMVDGDEKDSLLDVPVEVKPGEYSVFSNYFVADSPHSTLRLLDDKDNDTISSDIIVTNVGVSQQPGYSKTDLEQLNETKVCKLCDLKGAPLANKSLDSTNLDGAYLKGADLENAQLKNATLADAVMAEANLSGANLEDASLEYSDLTGALLNGTTLINNDLGGTVLEGAQLWEADLKYSYADEPKANLNSAYLYKADLSTEALKDDRETDLVRTSLQHAYLGEVKAANTYLGGVDLTEAYLANIDLTGADLSPDHPDSQPSPVPVILKDTFLRSAHLEKANLTGAQLQGADLRDAQLQGADLTDADLTGANLTDVNLTNTVLTGVTLKDANLTRVDFSKSKGLGNSITNKGAYLCNTTGPQGSVEKGFCEF